MLTWREGHFFITQIADSPRSAKGWTDASYFFGVEKHEGETITGAPASFFAITHLRSGYSACRGVFQTLEQAQLFCERIAPLSDWQFDRPMKDEPWYRELGVRVREEAQDAGAFFGPRHELPWHDGDEAEQ